MENTTSVAAGYKTQDTVSTPVIIVLAVIGFLCFFCFLYCIVQQYRYDSREMKRDNDQAEQNNPVTNRILAYEIINPI